MCEKQALLFVILLMRGRLSSSFFRHVDENEKNWKKGLTNLAKKGIMLKG